MRKFFTRNSGDSHQPSPEPPSPSFSSVSSTGPARPIRLVYCDEKGKFRMDPEAVATLQLVKEPVGVVSVCGRARQGKSFILNQLLGKSSGFQVASTHRPCTKGLWLWSAPIKRIALDGTEYNLLLLDSEGIDAYDQTGTYSTQIFSLAVLLSSMFIYNQMGGIDETALDRLSLVTEMTKHIRVRASGGRSTASELGQFSPIFVWLLRDFYLDLAEDNRKITPRDYLELALRPVQGSGRDIASKNEIRESIRALFPDRECFTLVRPLSNENELQRLDQIPMDKLRSEFRSGLDALTKFVFERTRPKQLGATVMTGPILACITQSFLDAINNGAVPTITSSWQSVEEAECQRAYDLATEVYMSGFDRSKPPEEAALREAHEEAFQKSMSAFNGSAVGAGSTRQKYEKRLHNFLRKAFEDFKRDAFREAYLQCSNAIQNMEKELRTACHAPDAKIDNVLKVLDDLVSKYETSSHGPEKWQKLTAFLRQSLEGTVADLIKKQIDRVGSEKSSLMLKCRSIEDKMGLLNKQLEASEKYKSEYLKRYEDAINDKKKLADDYMSRITNLQSKCSSLEERCSSLSKTLDSARLESTDWKRKYEQALSKKKAEEGQASSEIAILKSKSSAAEARLAAAREQAQSAQEDAEEWKRKYDIAVREAKAALEKAAVVQERSNKQTQLREDALREEFSVSLAEKEEEMKDKAAKIEHAEQRLTTLSLELKAAVSKIRNYDLEISTVNHEIKELGEKLETANATAQSFERQTKMLEQEKLYLEQKYQSEFDRFEEVQGRCKTAEREAKRATELADKARAEAATAQKEKSEIQRIAMERLTQIERAERHIESLLRQKADLANEAERYRVAEMDAVSKVAMLEARVEEREREIETLLKSNNEQRATTVQVLESLLETERAARAEATNRAEALSVKLQVTQGKLDSLQQKMTEVRLNETALDNKLKTQSHGKRVRADGYEIGVDSVQDMDINEKGVRGNKRSRSMTSPLKTTQPEDGGSVFRGDDENHSQQTNSDDYTRFTVQRLKQELTKHNFGAELLQLKNLNKKDIISLYEKHVLQKL
ncbi:Guanylate-binding protein 4 [Camellia lanceoleosa]|uniref:Guanylate-binding protein 4 n=1 Tax=Camellia lanceoleosa TaxID=1840588 RepID=A0ACC0GK62_9ERIC|nr:Guanylate-binding protein 4 [Camellia lanceoleosa]